MPLGVLKVKVHYNKVSKKLEIIVVKGGPPILGREWLTELSIPIYSDIYLVLKLTSYQNVV